MVHKLTAEQCQVLVGLLLGDANLQTENNGRTYRLRVTQAEQNKDYLFAIYNLFKPLVGTPPRIDSFFDRRTGKTYKRWVFSTTQQACFRFYGKQFYVNGKKRIPPLIDKWLTPLGFAYWYMDDGAQKWKGKSLGVRLCTDGFAHHEVRRVADLLAAKYGLKTSLQKKGKGLRIYLSSNSYEELRRLISPYLLPSMLYKFPTPSENPLTRAFQEVDSLVERFD